MPNLCTEIQDRSPIHAPPDAAQRTHIRQLLRSHSTPPDELPSILSTLSKELQRYDADISSLEEMLDRLRNERAAFQAHYDNCQSLLAPIRRLPSETLVEIFDMCWGSFTPAFEELESVSIDTELKRLAHAPLLDLSQVCARWHAIVMGTPSLWATIELEGVLWESPLYLGRVQILLQTLLDRSANHLLAVSVADDTLHAPGPVFNLLARHSAQWRTATFRGSFTDLHHLSVATGNIPHLNSLDMHCLGGAADAATALKIFQVAPSLRNLELVASTETLSAFSNLPLEQLNNVRCYEEVGSMPLAAAAFASGLPPSTTFRLQIQRSDEFQQAESVFPAAPATSHIWLLVFEINTDFSSADTGQIVGKLIEAFTLPNLQGLGFVSPGTDHPTLPLLWPHSEFLSLSRRSSFHAQLRFFVLAQVLITEPELLECLSALPGLELLSITDQKHDLAGDVLIADTLLTRLTLTPHSPALVPGLRHFVCYSKLRFSDEFYLNFLVSRVSPSYRFECELFWFPGHERPLDPTVSRRIQTLCGERKLSFSFARGDKL
ncbi:hypothetical protein DFH09DRAFT_1365678 [Mycena vulgaris]|nr:hypothetical protein DFH09DRAFT_1365678 [Mycena vulgaris]